MRNMMTVGALLLVIGYSAPDSFAQTATTAVAPPFPGRPNAVGLVRLMDRDRNGKVSKQEFMSYMARVFDQLDVNKDGELDVDELSKLQYQANPGWHK
jgi:hypothetical protein